MTIASIQKIAQKSFKDARKRALASKVPVVEYENQKLYVYYQTKEQLAKRLKESLFMARLAKKKEKHPL